MTINKGYRVIVKMPNISRSYKERTADYPERTRNKIAASTILPELIKYAEGSESKLDHSRALIAVKLLGKLVPDLQSTQVDVSITNNQLNIHELNARLQSLGYEPQNVWSQLNGEAPITIEHEPPVDNMLATSEKKAIQDDHSLEGATPAISDAINQS
jgi:hypothetical protein